MPDGSCGIVRLAPAKLNLALSVGPPRGERGYHPIASWMVALRWGDELRLEKSPNERSRFDILFADDAPRGQPIDWPLERDLAWRAHARLESHVGRPLAIRAKLAKRIPTGAGLGGGSSDAAAMLLGLNDLFSLDLSPQALADLSQPLGSDIAFLVHAAVGEPSAVVTGFGEVIDPSPLKQPLHAALFFPDARCATADVYRAFDANPSHAADEARVRSLAAIASPDPLLFNDLAAPAFAVAPRLREIHHALEAAIRRRVHVTGSGAAMFTLAEDWETASALAAAARAATGAPALPVSTLGGPVASITAR